MEDPSKIPKFLFFLQKHTIFIIFVVVSSMPTTKYTQLSPGYWTTELTLEVHCLLYFPCGSQIYHKHIYYPFYSEFKYVIFNISTLLALTPSCFLGKIILWHPWLYLLYTVWWVYTYLPVTS